MKNTNTKRKDGRYAVQIYIGMVNGKRKVKTVYGKSQKEAEKKANEVRQKLAKGLQPSDQDTFKMWAEYYLNAKKADVSASQFKLCKARTDYWIDALGSFKINSMRPVDIQPAFNDLYICNPRTKKPSAKRTLMTYKQILAAVFEYAIDNRAIDYNPALKIKIPQNATINKRRSLTPEERQHIIEMEHRGKLAMMLLMFSGIRRGEATCLLWSDIDFENNTISVTKSYDFKQKALKPPKNKKSRVVSVPQILIDYLKTVKKSSTLVLTTKNGGIMTETAWKRLLDSYLCDLNLTYGTFTNKINKFAPEKKPMVIEPFTIHCLRHTFCTMMYEAGVDVLTAKEQMGHSDVKTTLAIYTHLDNEHKLNNISKLDNYVKNEYSSQNSSQIV